MAEVSTWDRYESFHSFYECHVNSDHCCFLPMTMGCLTSDSDEGWLFRVILNTTPPRMKRETYISSIKTLLTQDVTLQDVRLCMRNEWSVHNEQEVLDILGVFDWDVDNGCTSCCTVLSIEATFLTGFIIQVLCRIIRRNPVLVSLRIFIMYDMPNFVDLTLLREAFKDSIHLVQLEILKAFSGKYVVCEQRSLYSLSDSERLRRSSLLGWFLTTPDYPTPDEMCQALVKWNPALSENRFILPFLLRAGKGLIVDRIVADAVRKATTFHPSTRFMRLKSKKFRQITRSVMMCVLRILIDRQHTDHVSINFDAAMQIMGALAERLE